MCDQNFLHVSFPHGVAHGSSHPLHLRLWHHQHVGRPLFMTLLSNVPCDLITKQIIETLEQGVCVGEKEEEYEILEGNVWDM